MNIYNLIYTYCTKNKDLLKKYKNCTCLYCGKNFDYEMITEWVNDGKKTAICPYCYIDSVVPTEVDNGTDKYKITKEIQE